MNDTSINCELRPVSQPQVSILLATYNGETWLQEQLDSFASQTFENWQLIASDDGSTDQTRDILRKFLTRNRGTLLEGPRAGGSANFLSLVQRLSDHQDAGAWFAFSDQDDVWLPERLERGYSALSAVPEDRPALYCSRTWVVDDALENRKISAPRPRGFGFRNALIQNIAAGNTILVNAAAARLLCSAAQEIDSFVVHDWWAYQVISAAGGQIIHDDTPSILYRQHAGNEIGANLGQRAQVVRFLALLRGQLREWNAQNIVTLQASAHRFTAEHQAHLQKFVIAHEGSFFARIQAALQIGLYRQSWLGTASVYVSAILKRL